MIANSSGKWRAARRKKQKAPLVQGCLLVRLAEIGLGNHSMLTDAGDKVNRPLGMGRSIDMVVGSDDIAKRYPVIMTVQSITAFDVKKPVDVPICMADLGMMEFMSFDQRTLGKQIVGLAGCQAGITVSPRRR